jgi:2-polyprenyl-3-methyl-5-hydroxy-6-metoxy-1,4-benzoquinol methylase
MRKRKPAPEFKPNLLSPAQYLEHWQKRKVWTHLEYPKHRKRLNWCADQCVGASFADVGCMFGHSTAIMAERKRGAWVGIDFTTEAIIKAWQIFPTLSFLFLPDVNALSLAGEYDSIVCSEVIEHVPDDRGLVLALLGMARHRVIMTTPTIDAQDPGHLRIYTDESLRETLDGFRYSIERDESFFYITIESGRCAC